MITFQFTPVVTEPLSFCKEKWWVRPPWKFLEAEDMLPMRYSLGGSRGPYQGCQGASGQRDMLWARREGGETPG